MFNYPCRPLICHCLLMTNPSTSCHRTCSETLWRARGVLWKPSELFKIENELASKRVKWIGLGEDPPPPGEGPFFLCFRSVIDRYAALSHPPVLPLRTQPRFPQVKSRSPARQRHSAYRKCTRSFHGSSTEWPHRGKALLTAWGRILTLPTLQPLWERIARAKRI